MLVIDGQFALQLKIGDKTDFLAVEDFHYMNILENAGGLRPIVTLCFTIKNKDLLPYINSGNVLYIQFGKDSPSSDVYAFEILGDTKTQNYAVGTKVVIQGAMYNPMFIGKTRSYCYKDQYSYQVLQKLASNNNMTLRTNITKTNDRCNWYQNAKTDWNLFNDICTKAYINDDTFISYAIDNNNLYVYDVRKLVKSGPKWILSVKEMGNEQSNIINIPSYQVDGSYASDNGNIAGKNVTNVDYNLDTGVFSYPTHTLKTFTSLDTNKININSEGHESYEYNVSTDEQHANAAAAINNNVRNNVLFSSYCCYVPTAHRMTDFRLLDLVELHPAETDADAEGYYFITAIARCFKSNVLEINLTLNRESANGIRSDKLEVGDN